MTGYKYVKKFAEAIKNQSPNTIIGVGNSVASSIPEILLTKTCVDVAFLGEGDITDVEFLHALEQGEDWSTVEGIAYRDDSGEIVYTSTRPPIEDISKLHIDYSLFEVEKYIPWTNKGITQPAPVPTDKLRAFTINTARGCVNRCTFCYHVFRHYKYRHRSIKAILNEVEYLMTHYGVNYFLLNDDLTFYHKSVIEEFLEEKERRGLDFYWTGTCRGNLFKEDKDVELIQRMKRNGCHSMGYSLESSSPDILKAMNKSVTVEEFRRQTELFNRGGVMVVTSIVVGYPQETPESIRNTFNVCIECGVVPSVGYLLPQPGSEIYDYAVKEGFIPNIEAYLLELGDRQDLRLNLTTMSDNELETTVEDNIRRSNEILGVVNATDNLLKTQNYYVPKMQLENK